MEQSAREKFFERIETAPLAARGFGSCPMTTLKSY